MRNIIKWIATLIFAASSIYIAYYAYDLWHARVVNTELQQDAPDYNSIIEEVELSGQLVETTATPEENTESQGTEVSEDNTESQGTEVSEDNTESQGTEVSEDNWTETVEVEPLEMSEHMKRFYEKNNDTVGWLFLSGTKINYPVVQTTDNDKYLHTDFYGNESQPGTLFVDYRCNLLDYAENQSDNIIIYGHKQADGEMFGTLNKYQNNLEFYKEHPIFIFQNLYEVYLYKIIGAFVCKAEETSDISEESFDYQNYINFQEEGRYSREEFLNKLEKYNEYDLPVDIQDDDKFITLSTCSYEYNGARFVVVGRRLRESEYPGVDISKAVAVSDYLIY